MATSVKKNPVRNTSEASKTTFPAGFRLIPAALCEAEQKALLTAIQNVILSAPLFQPRMPKTGQPFSVKMTNCGPLGWVSDKERGYRYQKTHLDTGKPWPPIPPILLELWRAHAGCEGLPEACLINHYPAGAKMGSHRDKDEDEPRAPVLSVSLGDDAVFHVGGDKRGDPKVRVTLRSGDVCLLGGASRFAYHGIDRILPGTSDLVPGGGRINLTLRRVTRFA
jgi:alkylated DNA repair protein (DNA oxidative demethylase)